jgi:hypothetical protein
MLRGMVTYLAVSADGKVEARSIERGRLPEARVVVEMWNALDERDPVKPLLTLIQPTLPGEASDATFHLRCRPRGPSLPPVPGRRLST